MDQELNDRLTRLEKMVSDNNRMLVKMRRAQRNAAYMRVLYWIVIVLMAVASWYLIQPYLASLTSEYSAITDGNSSGMGNDSSSIMNLINQYTAGQKTAQ